MQSRGSTLVFELHERPGMQTRSPAILGATLGGANIIVIALVHGFASTASPASYAGHHWPQSIGLSLVLVVVFVGMSPALGAGAIVGWIAGALQDELPAVRLSVLALLAFAIVAVFGEAAEAPHLTAVAQVSTFGFVALLEACTRGPTGDAVPRAIVVTTPRDAAPRSPAGTRAA